MSSRRNRDSPISLFYFQDIITCVSGIMILLMLIFAISAPKDTKSEPDSWPNQKRLAADRSEEIGRLREHVAGLRKVISSSAYGRESVQLQSKMELIEKTKRKKNSELRKLLVSIGGMDKEIAEIEQRRLTAQEELQKIQRTKEVKFIAEKGDGKTPILVECSENSMRCGVAGRSVDPVTINYEDENRFLDYIKGFRTDSHFFVFMIKPSAPALDVLIFRTREAGFHVGYDALEDEYGINFSESER
ncbi:MAG: hypothetical protein ACI96M_002876 [Candidatus Azotimanducaceae bacterium]|jgi:hypothetical protein